MPQDHLADDLAANPGTGGVGGGVPTEISVYQITENVDLTGGLIDPPAAFPTRQVPQAMVSTTDKTSNFSTTCISRFLLFESGLSLTQKYMIQPIDSL
jgi:hypothetical protein